MGKNPRRAHGELRRLWPIVADCGRTWSIVVNCGRLWSIDAPGASLLPDARWGFRLLVRIAIGRRRRIRSAVRRPAYLATRDPNALHLRGQFAALVGIRAVRKCLRGGM